MSLPLSLSLSPFPLLRRQHYCLTVAVCRPPPSQQQLETPTWNGATIVVRLKVKTLRVLPKRPRTKFQWGKRTRKGRVPYVLGEGKIYTGFRCNVRETYKSARLYYYYYYVRRLYRNFEVIFAKNNIRDVFEKYPD